MISLGMRDQAGLCAAPLIWRPSRFICCGARMVTAASAMIVLLASGQSAPYALVAQAACLLSMLGLIARNQETIVP
jgi:hypothetical protein